MEELTLWGIQGRGLAKSQKPTLGALIARPLDRAVQVTALATVAMTSCPSAIQICTLPDIGEIGAHQCTDLNGTRTTRHSNRCQCP